MTEEIKKEIEALLAIDIEDEDELKEEIEKYVTYDTPLWKEYVGQPKELLDAVGDKLSPYFEDMLSEHRYDWKPSAVCKRDFAVWRDFNPGTRHEKLGRDLELRNIIVMEFEEFKKTAHKLQT